MEIMQCNLPPVVFEGTSLTMVEYQSVNMFYTIGFSWGIIRLGSIRFVSQFHANKLYGSTLFEQKTPSFATTQLAMLCCLQPFGEGTVSLQNSEILALI